MTWRALFELLGYEWCKQCELGENIHERGKIVDGKFHWLDRRVTRAGMYAVLRRIGEHDLPRKPEWRYLHKRNVAVLALAKKLHIRFPANTFLLDKARVRALLATHPTSERNLWPAEMQIDFIKARAWSQHPKDL